MQQALSSLDSIEQQRPGSTQSLRPAHRRRGTLAGIHRRGPARRPHCRRHDRNSGLDAQGHAALRYQPFRPLRVPRRLRSAWPILCAGLGEDSTQRLLEILQTAPANEAAETIGLLSHFAPDAVDKILPVRLSQWPRSSHDRAVRQLSSAPPEQRARLLVSLYDSLDALIRPLAIDEMGMSGQHECIPKLVELAQNDHTPPFHRLKALEALGPLARLRRQPHAAAYSGCAAGVALGIPDGIANRGSAGADADRSHHGAGKTQLQRTRAQGFDARTHRSRTQLFGDAPTALRAAETFEKSARRHHQLARKFSAVDSGTQPGRRNRRRSTPSGAGFASVAQVSHGVRNIKAQAIVRGARPQAMAFEFVDMDMEDRSRLRKVLMELGGLPQVSAVTNRSKRRGRVALNK